MKMQMVQEMQMEKTEVATELEFLKWFYAWADFGPADSDVRESMKEYFVKSSGKQLPEGYEIDVEDV